MTEPATRPVLRFAPSPNGRLHLGHAYSALLNAALAQRFGGRLLLRIEDIDRQRSKPELIAAIVDDLAWLGLRFEAAPWRQSERLPIYAEALAALRARGLVYPCFCSRGQIAARVAALDAEGCPVPRDPDGTPLYPGTCRALSPAEAQARCEAGEAPAWRLAMRRALAAEPGPHAYRRLCLEDAEPPTSSPAGGGGREVNGGGGAPCHREAPPTPPRSARSPSPQGRGEANKLDRHASAWERDIGPHTRGEDACPSIAPLVSSPVSADPARWGDVVLARRDVGTSYHLAVVIDDAAQGITHVVRGRDLEAATDLHVLLQRLFELGTPVYHHHGLVRAPDGEKLAKSRGSEALADLRAQGVSPGEVRARLGFD